MTERLNYREVIPAPERYRPVVDIITISGHPGTGKTVVGNNLAQMCGMEFIKVGELFREYMKQKHGKNVHGFTPRPGFVDEMFDRYQRLLMDCAGKIDRKIVLEGRLAGLIATEYMEENPNSQTNITRILFTASREERVRRISNRYEGLSIVENARLTQEREKGDLSTWKRFHPRIAEMDDLYDTSITDNNGIYPFADIIIDTTKPKPGEVTKELLTILEARGDITKNFS